jgi:hypothetical protein
VVISAFEEEDEKGYENGTAHCCEGQEDPGQVPGYHVAREDVIEDDCYNHGENIEEGEREGEA